MKSRETWVQGRLGVGKGWRRPGGARVDGLVSWHVGHDLMYALTVRLMCGHQ